MSLDNDYFNDDDDDDGVWTREDLEGLTMTQLKQQLRLRGLKVSGRKAELIERLLGLQPRQQQQPQQPQPPPPPQQQPQTMSNDIEDDIAAFLDAEILAKETTESKKSRARTIAEQHGKELVDVSEYLDEKDKGKDVLSSTDKHDDEENNDDDDEDEDGKSTTGTWEKWGVEARIVDDYEGRSVVVDGLSRTLVEFAASNNSYCQAYVVASRDALKPFLAGSAALPKNGTETPEDRLREIQAKRERASILPTLPDDEENDGPDEGDQEGIYNEAIQRDYSDWGTYTTTGAQLSAQEIQGVILLSDVYGPFQNNTQALADRIAFECQPVVVMAPDLFRGRPWSDEQEGEEEEEQLDYEEWRALHPALRVSMDIRAAAACLRERYGVCSIAVWGTCYGGGRALEVASGRTIQDQTIHDVDGKIGPPPVRPMAVIAWYPTRYNVTQLFGDDEDPELPKQDKDDESFAVMAIMGEQDTLAGATSNDAALLQERLGQDERVRDYMVKVFPDQGHGFAHMHLGRAQEDDDDNYVEDYKSDEEMAIDEEFGGAGRVMFGSSDADVAFLLSTAWMETYTRVFLPTVGTAVSQESSRWNSNNDLTMPGNGKVNDRDLRDLREEIQQSIDNFSPPPNNFNEMSEDEHDERTRRILMSYQDGKDAGQYTIDKDDDTETMLQKLKAWDSNLELF